MRRNVFEIRVDTACDTVIRCCAEREETWISDEIVHVYGELHRRGYVHSVESWHRGDLVGGLYGVAIRGAFFGESMFSKMTDASKVALAHLVGRSGIGSSHCLTPSTSMTTSGNSGPSRFPGTSTCCRLSQR